MLQTDPTPTPAAPPHRAANGPWAIMKPVQGQIRVAMFLSATAAVLNLLALAGLAWTVHALTEQPGHWPWPALLAVVLSTATSYGLRLSAFNQSHYAAFKLERVLRLDISQRLAQVPLGYAQTQGAGALSKVIHDDVKALHIFVADSTPLYARACATPAVTLLALMWLDWRLATGTVVVLALGFGVLSLAMQNRHEMVRLYNGSRERVSAAIVEFVQAMPVVRTFDTGQTTFSRYQEALAAYLAVVTRWYREAGFSARFSMAILSPLPTLLTVLVIGLWLASAHALDNTQFVAVLLLCTGMAEAMMPAMALMHMVEKVKLSITRIQEVLAAPVLPEPAAGSLQQPTQASVTFVNVSFRYASGETPALKGVSFHAPAGTVTALVGPSGAGKSTVAKLIPRFWDVTEGRVMIGDVDIRDMSADALMKQVAFVFQDTFLFADTLAANIRLGTPNATMADVIAAATAAQAHSFIEALPNGYDTHAGERGTFLSGGQRQRITIARAILQNRPILVLDEATAFADPENELALIQALSVLMRGKTVLMVAHRLNTIRDADQILVFDKGQLVEHGRHPQLMATHGVYARLWHSSETAQNWTLGVPTEQPTHPHPQEQP